MKSLVAALLVLAVLVGGATGCAPDEGTPEPEQSEVEQIRAAREALGDPMLRLAGALVRATELLDAVRHELPRGEGMVRAVEATAGEVDDLRQAAEEAARAAADNEAVGGRVTTAAAVVAAAAEEARAAADQLDAEVQMLARLAAIDVELDAAVAEWDAPGPQAERHDTLLAQAEAVTALAEEAREVEPAPAACTRPRDSRVRWAELVAQRSQRLAEAATPGEGTTYDELRDAFRRSPYGEDRRAAADAGCWRSASALAQAAQGIEERVEALEDALS